jgi:hypothetical protein
MEVRAVQESADTIYLVLPRASAVGEGEELSDLELEVVAGGDTTTSLLVWGCAKRRRRLVRRCVRGAAVEA